MRSQTLCVYRNKAIKLEFGKTSRTAYLILSRRQTIKLPVLRTERRSPRCNEVCEVAEEHSREVATQAHFSRNTVSAKSLSKLSIGETLDLPIVRTPASFQIQTDEPERRLAKHAISHNQGEVVFCVHLPKLGLSQAS